MEDFFVVLGVALFFVYVSISIRRDYEKGEGALWLSIGILILGILLALFAFYLVLI